MLGWDCVDAGRSGNRDDERKGGVDHSQIESSRVARRLDREALTQQQLYRLEIAAREF
jgi:hypothetical protein